MAELQRRLLTQPDSETTSLEHHAREKWQVLAKAKAKFYHQRSRVQWYDLGDMNTSFYHKVADQRAYQNHIHFLYQSVGGLVSGIYYIKEHTAEYFSQILGVTDMVSSPYSVADLEDLLPFRCSNENISELVKPV